MMLCSFIIPCKNEEKYILKCINSILNQRIQFKKEIIVIDNGSTDKTLEILKSVEEKIIIQSKTEGNISNLRNFGATLANGEWLIFLDGDVELDKNWANTFLKIINEFRRNNDDIHKFVTGSTCVIPNDYTWIEHVWYTQLNKRKNIINEYINSGHFIISNTFFNDLGGFNPDYITGEDEKICEDAKKKGGIIRNEKSLIAIHHGYPKTLKQFFRRERWHGIGLKKHIFEILKYRDLQIAFYNIGIVILAFVLIILKSLNSISIIIIFTILILPITIFAFLRINGKVSLWVPLSVLFFVYGIAKTIALFDIFLLSFQGKFKNKHK